MEVNFDAVLMVLAWCLVGIFALFAAVSIYKNQILKYQLKTLDVNDTTRILKLKEQYITDLESEIEGYRKDIEDLNKDVGSWQGKYRQKGQIKKLDPNKYDLTKTSDIGIVAEDVLDQIAPNLPGDLQQIIKDPKIRDMILGYANEHPDEAIEYIKKFIGTSGTNKTSGKTNASIIPDFDASKAI